MSRITKNAELELLKVIQGINNNDLPSTILPNPKFKKQSNTTFMSDIDNVVGTGDVKINNVLTSKDILIVIANYDNDTKGALAFYNSQLELFYVITQFDDGGIKKDFVPFKFVKLNSQSVLYGLAEDTNGTYFFIYDDILNGIGVLEQQDISDESFFPVFFQVDKETIKGSDGKDLKVKIGNTFFKDYDVIDMNQDFFNEDIYAFALYKLTDKTIFHVKIETDLNEQNADEADWQINEPVQLSTGITGAGGDFDGISTLGVGSGDTGDSIGSVLFSVQKDAGQVQTAIFNAPIVTTSPRTYTDTKDTSVRVDGSNRKGELFTQEVANRDNFFNAWLSRIQSIIDSGGTILEEDPNDPNNKTSGTIKLTNKFGNGFISLQISKKIIDDMLDINNTIKINETISLEYSTSFIGSAQSFSTIRWITMTTKTSLLINDIEVSSATFSDKQKANNFLSAFSASLILNAGNARSTLTRFSGLSFTDRQTTSISTDISEDINIVYSRQQVSIGKNTTSQVLIKESNSTRTYDIVQSESNSFQGTQPKAISPTKWFIPLKEKGSGNANIFNIFEFNGVIGTILQNKFLNDQAERDYDDANNDLYVNSDLVNPQSIISVVINGNQVDSSRYTFDKATGEVTVKTIKQGDTLVFEYQTFIGIPKRVNVTNKPQGDNVFIEKVEDQGELSSTGFSIIGAGTGGAGNVDEQFGFNLYRSKANIDFDELAEEVETVAGFTIRHVKGFRQKDLLFILGFNEDYSQVLEWVQIYPDSFKPYVYLPYANPNEYFAIERFNQNKQNELKNSVFDREFLDFGITGKTIIATTTAEYSDLNDNDNDYSVIFGHTNEPLFTRLRTINKNRNERHSIQFNLSTTFLDILQNKNIENISQSELLAQLFADKDKDAHNKIALDTFTISNSDGTTISDNVSQYLRLDETEAILYFELSMLVRDKEPQELSMTNVNGDNIITIDLTGQNCPEGVLNLQFQIVLSDNPEGIDLEFFQYNETNFDLPYKKGGN